MDKIQKDENQNKQKFIKAGKLTIERYKKREYSGLISDCYYCQVVGGGSFGSDCAPCPMAVPKKMNMPGCTLFKSSLSHGRNIKEEEFENRIKFHKEYLIPLMESMPEEQFAIGFKYIEHDWSK